MNQLDAFEQRIRDVLEPFEVPYNSADWAQLEKTLDSGRKPSWWGGLGFYAALVAGALAIGGTTYLITRGGEEGPGNSAFTEATDPTVDREDGDRPSAPGPVASQAALPDQAPATAEESADLPAAGNADGAHPGRVRSGLENALAGTARSSAPAPDRHAVPDLQGARLPAKAGNATPATPDEEPTGMLIRPSVAEGCPGTTVEFAAEHLPEEGIFLWNFGDGSFSNKPNPSHTYSKSGRFEVMLSHSSMAGGNIHNKPSSDLIVIHEAPEADFVPQRQAYDGHLPSVHFENRSLGGKEYHWDFGDGVTTSVPHPDHVFRRKGTYHVELVVTNARGCVDRVEKQVVVEHDYNLLAPEAFSPNGDGTNDLFIPEALRELELRFKLSIHDPASGELVYETTDASKPWTGRVMNRGDLCAPGTYVWVVEFPDALHLSDIPFQGEVTLVR